MRSWNPPPALCFRDLSSFTCTIPFRRASFGFRRVRDGRRAVLEEVRSYGVFTIGAQVRNTLGEWVGLELDLSGLPDLPKRFLDR